MARLFAGAPSIDSVAMLLAVRAHAALVDVGERILVRRARARARCAARLTAPRPRTASGAKDDAAAAGEPVIDFGVAAADETHTLFLRVANRNGVAVHLLAVTSDVEALSIDPPVRGRRPSANESRIVFIVVVVVRRCRRRRRSLCCWTNLAACLLRRAVRRADSVFFSLSSKR